MKIKTKYIKLLYKFIKKNNLSDKFIRAFNDDYQIILRYNFTHKAYITDYTIFLFNNGISNVNENGSKTFDNFFLYAFNWRNTYEGHDFWANIHFKWRDKCHLKKKN